MIRGEFTAISGTIIDANIERDISGGAFELIEVTVAMDASGLAQVELPFVAGCPSQYQVKLGTGGVAPAANFDLTIVGRLGRLAAGTVNILAATTISASVNPTTISGTTLNRLSGPLNINITNSNASNSGKQATIALQIGPPSRNYV